MPADREVAITPTLPPVKERRSATDAERVRDLGACRELAFVAVSGGAL